MSEHEHEWYVKGSHESNISLKSNDPRLSWADLKLECINYDDTNCEKEASVMINVDPKRIMVIDDE